MLGHRFPRNPRGGVFWWVCSARVQACCLTHYPADSGPAATIRQIFVCLSVGIDPGPAVSARKTAWRQDNRSVTGKAARESAGMGVGCSIPDRGQGGNNLPDGRCPIDIAVIQGQCRSAMVGRTFPVGMGRCWIAEAGRASGYEGGIAEVVAVTTRCCLGCGQGGRVEGFVETVGVALG